MTFEHRNKKKEKKERKRTPISDRSSGIDFLFENEIKAPNAFLKTFSASLRFTFSCAFWKRHVLLYFIILPLTSREPVTCSRDESGSNDTASTLFGSCDSLAQKKEWNSTCARITKVIHKFYLHQSS